MVPPAHLFPPEAPRTLYNSVSDICIAGHRQPPVLNAQCRCEHIAGGQWGVICAPTMELRVRNYCTRFCRCHKLAPDDPEPKGEPACMWDSMTESVIGSCDSSEGASDAVSDTSERACGVERDIGCMGALGDWTCCERHKCVEKPLRSQVYLGLAQGILSTISSCESS